MDKRVLVIGAAGGIGHATAVRLAAAGYSVIGSDRRVPGSTSTFEDFLEVDLRDRAQVRRGCTKLVRSCGKCWGVVYCAGIYPIQRSLAYSEELWDEVIDVNLSGAFLVVREFSGTIVTGGSVVLVASGAAYLGSRDVAYSASKAGLVGFGRSLVRLLGARGIRVNCINPGVIETEMSARMGDVSLGNYLARIPFGRLGRPDEIASVVEFLMSEDSSYISGAIIDVNGGLYAR